MKKNLLLLFLCSFVFFLSGLSSAKAQNNFNTSVVNPFGITPAGPPAYKPELFDLDGDGDLDILAGAFNGSFYYYENTGTATAPNYATAVINPFGLTDTAQDATVSMEDIDADGDLDLISGNLNDGFLLYSRNNGSATNPAFASFSINPFGLTAAGSQSEPRWVDLDNDNDFDLIVGNTQNKWYYFENTGTPTTPSYGPRQTNPLGLSNDGARNTADFVDFDQDGDLDLFVGSQNTQSIFYYENTGTVSSPNFPARITSPFGYSGNFSQTTPKLADMDNDGDIDLLLGNSQNNFRYFENTLFNSTCNVNIPDANLKAALVANSNINTNGDTEIQCSEAANFTGILTLNSLNITGATGLETFVNTTSISLKSNNLTAIDLSLNTALTNVDLRFNNNLSSVNFGSNPNLFTINVFSCALTSIDLTGLPALGGLIANSNNLSIIDVSQNPNLETLRVASNVNINTIDISNNPDLVFLDIGNTGITTFDVSTAPDLNTLVIGATDIASVDVSNNPLLSSFSAGVMPNLISIDLSNNPNLTSVVINSNPNLTSIDLRNGNNTSISDPIFTNNPNLTCINVDDVDYSTANWTSVDAQTTFSLNCSNTGSCNVNIPDPIFKAVLLGNANINTNGDSEIQCSEASSYTGTIAAFSQGIQDLTGVEAFTQAVSLQVFNNSITSLDLSQNLQLQSILAENNAIAGTVDLSMLTQLKDLKIHSNFIESLNVANGNNPNFTRFEAQGNSNLTCIQIDPGFTPPNFWLKDPGTGFGDNCANQEPIAVCQNLMVQLDATGNTTIVASQIDNGSIDTDGTITLSIDQTSFDCSNLGINNVTLTVTDDQGAVDNCTATVTVVDVIPPTIVTPTNATFSNDPGQCGTEVFFSLSASDNCGTPTVTSDVAPNSLFPIGTTTVTLTANDGNGNTSTSSFTITINDTEAPTATCPSDYTVTVNQGEQFEVPDFIFLGVAYGTDNCSGGTVVQTPNFGTMLGAGTHPISIDVTDNSGNTASCSFNLTVDVLSGIQDQIINDISIYPNPATAQITITGVEDFDQVAVYDLMGKQIKRSSTPVLNIEELPAAVYLLSITDRAGYVAMKSFIKK